QTLARLDTVANASPALFWTSGLDKGCNWFNRRWLEFTGRSMEQELGDGWTEGVHPEDYARCMQTYVQAFDARQAFSMEYRLRRNDGAYRWLLDSGLPRHDADGHFVGFIGSCLDITEDKLLREALRDSEERLRLALRAANQGLYDLDLRTGDAKVSPEYASMLGYDAATFRETNAAWRARLHPDDAPRVAQAFTDYVGGRLPEYRIEFRQRTANGDWKWILSLGRIQEWSADGVPLRMLGTHTDIDAIKAAEARLREANASLEIRVADRTAELQTLNQSLESFVYSVSHDLKAPLRGVEGYSRLLEEDYAGRLDRRGPALHHQHSQRRGADGRTDRRPARVFPHGAPQPQARHA
ncbi:PAS domain-containing protein, partial [Arthrospira platensis SPKY1]|nr:PAS domain-containing protein [Arthrospira platensis SPKY1]